MLFPAEVLPIVSVLSNMVHFFLGLLILVGFHGRCTGTMPDLGELIVVSARRGVQLVFTLALALFLSALTVHFRDIRDLLANLLTFWFFATPIIYSYYLDSVAEFKWLFNFNPFFHLAVSYQEILFFPGPVRSCQVAAGARRGIRRRSSSSRTGSSIGCVIRSRRRYERVECAARAGVIELEQTSRRSTGATAAGSSRR